MRSGVSISVSAADRRRLDAIAADRSTPQKHVWRARIVLLTAGGLGTNAIMAATGKSKTCVWRWQERFMSEGVDGLLRDRTRPSRIAPLKPEVTERVVSMTLTDAPGETTHWTADMMAAANMISASAVRRIWKAHGLQPHRFRQFKLSNDPKFADNSTMLSGFMSSHPRTPSCCHSTRKARFRRSTGPSRDCHSRKGGWAP